MIKLNNVVKSYKLKNNEIFKAVDNVSLEIKDGEIVGIVGYSGAGKSTLVRLINGLITPESGEVIIDDLIVNELDTKSLNQLRHNIGMIFQNYNLMSSLTVIDNIILSLKISNYSNSKEDLKARANEVIQLVGLEDKQHEYPKNLSGGQKQRVAIARAIANNPKYLLCDEITSALDNKTALEIVELLKLIKEKTNVTIVFISHQLEIVRALCNRVIIMEDGKVVEDNSTTNIFISPNANATKSLVGNLIDVSKYTNKYLLKYKNNANNQTLLSTAITNYGVVVNILEAQTINISDTIIGFMIIDITGKNTKDAIKFLKNNDVEVERI